MVQQISCIYLCSVYCTLSPKLYMWSLFLEFYVSFDEAFFLLIWTRYFGCSISFSALSSDLFWYEILKS